MPNLVEPKQTSTRRRSSVATIAECENAWREARCNDPAKLREIVSRESLRRSGMVLQCSTADTRVSKWLMKKFVEASRWLNRADYQLLVDAEAHGIACWARAPLLHLFARYSFHEGVNLLLAAGVDVDLVDQDNFTALHHLVSSYPNGAPQLLTLESLLNAGAARTPFPSGQTLLIVALARNSTEVAARLIGRGADVNETSPQGETALQFILRRFEPSFPAYSAVAEQVRLLLAAGADVNLSHKGMTPLHHAVDRKISAVIEMLLLHGAAVDAPGPADRTPVFFLQGFGDCEDVLKILVRHGANLKARNQDSLTAAEVAAATRNDQLARLLARYGG